MGDWDVVSTTPIASATSAPADSGGWDVVSHAPVKKESENKSLLSDVGDVLGQYFDKINPVKGAQGLVNGVMHPLDTIKAYGAQNAAIEQKAEDAFKAGNYGEGVRHIIGYLANGLPGIGSELDSAGDKAQKGDIKGSVADTAALATNLLGPKLAGKIVDALPDVSTPSIKGNPVQQAAVEFAKDNGIPVDAATATNSRFVAGAQHLAASTPGGFKTAENFRATQQQGLQRVAGELADESNATHSILATKKIVPGAPQTPESVGKSTAAALDRKIKGHIAEANANYDDLGKAVQDPKNTKTVTVGSKKENTGVFDQQGNPVTRDVPITRDIQMPVDAKPIKEQLAPVAAEIEKWWEPARRNSSAGYQAIKSILNGDDVIPADQAEKGLSGLKDLARTDDPNIRTVSQGIGARAVSIWQNAIDNAVGNADPKALTALQKGRAATASKFEVADVAKQLRDEPVQAFNQLTWKNDTGIDFLRKIQTQAPQQMQQLGRAFLDKLFAQATEDGGFSKTGTVKSQWENLGPKTKDLFYPDPVLRGNLDKFFDFANEAAKNPNPSGTAIVGHLVPSGILMVTNPMAGTAYMLSGAGASKLLHSAEGVKLLTQGIKLKPAMGTFANRVAQANIAGRILQIVGSGEVRQVDPSEVGMQQPALAQ